jgi:hypothetical protein
MDMIQFCLNHNPLQSAALIFLPDFAREGTSLHEEVTAITFAMKQCNLDSSMDIICTTKPDPSRENRFHAPWFSKGKLVTLGHKETKDKNMFLDHSMLAVRQRILGDLILPKAEDLEAVGSLDENEVNRTEDVHMDQAFKAAQKGSNFAKAQLAALMEGMPFKPEDVILIIDMYPHAGDRAKAVRDMTMNTCLDMVYLGLAGGAAAKYTEYAKRRVEINLFKDWLNGNTELTRTDAEGNVTAARPCRNVPLPSQEQLASIPGAAAAWQSLKSMKLHVLRWREASLIIDYKWHSHFRSAPQSVWEGFSDINEKHQGTYKYALVDFMDQNVQGQGQDPRAPPIMEGQEAAFNLLEYSSKELLSQVVEINMECKSQAKGVDILRDANHSTYLVSSVAMKLPTNTVLGGFGSGSWLAYAPGAKHWLQWDLVKGDKTVVSFHPSKTDNKKEKEDEGTEKAIKKETGKPQTMYAVLVDLEKQGNMDIKITSYGLVKAITEPGRHGYDLSTMDLTKAMHFSLAAENSEVMVKYSNGNCFAPGTTRDLYEGTHFDVKTHASKPHSKKQKPNSQTTNLLLGRRAASAVEDPVRGHQRKHQANEAVLRNVSAN